MSDNSRSEFAKFKSHLKNAIEMSNGDRVITARITYTFRRKTLEEVLGVKVRLTTIEYGQISIDEGDEINQHIAHLDFTLDFQNYAYNADQSLTITGQSSKMGGAYEVNISEV